MGVSITQRKLGSVNAPTLNGLVQTHRLARIRSGRKEVVWQAKAGFLQGKRNTASLSHFSEQCRKSYIVRHQETALLSHFPTMASS